MSTQFALIVLLVVVLLVAIWLIMRYGRPLLQWLHIVPRFPTVEEAEARAEGLLQASISPQEYSFLQQNGYLEVPSRLHIDRIYQIPRGRRRVRVYQVINSESKMQYQKLGELCVITCEPVPDADLVLTHKWLLEADEESYLATANWISGVSLF